MKNFLLTVSAFALIAGSAEAQEYLNQNFNGTTGTALPTGWSQTGSGWKTGTTSSLGSSYFPLPTVDGRMLAINDNKDAGSYGDQLVSTSSFSLATAAHVYATFQSSFLGGYSSSGAAEAFTLEASTDGGSTWDVVATIDPNTMYYWEPRYIDISDYAGEASVKLAFRYSDDGLAAYGAGIENLIVEEVPSTDISMVSVAPLEGSPTAYGEVGGNVTISGTVMNMGYNNITGYTVKYQQGTGTIYSYSATGTIAPFTTGNFTHGTPFAVPSTGVGVEYPIRVWVELTGDADADNNEGEAHVTSTAFMPTKRILFEEGTGTWCGWCPRGTAKMDEFAHDNPGVAAQVAVHNGDPMVVSAYDSYIGSLIGGYPSIVVDRMTTGDPGSIQAYYDQMKDNFGFAELTTGTVSMSGTTATVPVTIKPAIDIAGAKMALIVTESNLSGTGSGWSQTNYYAGGAQGPMGGWEDMPSSVPNTKFHFVARAISPSATGSATGVPATMTAGTEYTVNLTATINSAWSTADLQYIAVLIDDEGNVMNTSFTALPTLDPVFTSVSNVSAGINTLELYPNPATTEVNLNINLSDKANATITVADITGKVLVNNQNINLATGNSTYNVPTANLSNGIYFLTLTTEKGKATVKFVVAR